LGYESFYNSKIKVALNRMLHGSARTRTAFYEVSGMDVAVANEFMRQATMRQSFNTLLRSKHTSS
jgi:hypothetical protein